MYDKLKYYKRLWNLGDDGEPVTTHSSLPGRLMRQVDIVSKEAGLEPKRLIQWITAWAGLSAAWAMEDDTNAEPALTVARLALVELSL